MFITFITGGIGDREEGGSTTVQYTQYTGLSTDCSKAGIQPQLSFMTRADIELRQHTDSVRQV